MVKFCSDPFRMRPTLQRSKSYGVAEVSKSAPEPTDQDIEITNSVFDRFLFRNRKPRVCNAKSDAPPQGSSPIQGQSFVQAPAEGTSPRRTLMNLTSSSNVSNHLLSTALDDKPNIG